MIIDDRGPHPHQQPRGRRRARRRPGHARGRPRVRRRRSSAPTRRPTSRSSSSSTRRTTSRRRRSATPTTVAVGAAGDGRRQPARPGQHRHHRHRLRARPAGLDRLDEQHGGRRHQRDPDRRGDQPRQLAAVRCSTPQGEVIGITSSIATLSQPSPGSIGLGFAIPVNLAEHDRRAARSTDGTAEHAFLGVGLCDGTATADGVTRRGAVVEQVSDGSPAAKAELQAGDVDRRDRRRPRQRRASRSPPSSASAPPATEVTLTVVRDGETLEVDVTLAAAPETAQPEPQQQAPDDGQQAPDDQQGSSASRDGHEPRRSCGSGSSSSRAARAGLSTARRSDRPAAAAVGRPRRTDALAACALDDPRPGRQLSLASRPSACRMGSSLASDSASSAAGSDAATIAAAGEQPERGAGRRGRPRPSAARCPTRRRRRRPNQPTGPA